MIEKTIKKWCYKILFVLLILLPAIGFQSCGVFDKVAKSTDFNLKYKTALEYYEKKDYDRAFTLLSQSLGTFRGTRKDDSLNYYIAKSLFYEKDYAFSSQSCDEFRKRFLESPFLEEIEYLYAMSYFKQSPDIEKEQTSTEAAIKAFEEYIARYPNNEKVGEAQLHIAEMFKKLDAKAYHSAKLYHRMGKYKAAIRTFQNALKSFPHSDFRERILYYILESQYLYAKGSKESRKRERYQSVSDFYITFVSEYPDSKLRRNADNMNSRSAKYLEAIKKGKNNIKDKRRDKDIQSMNILEKEDRIKLKEQKKIENETYKREREKEKLEKRLADDNFKAKNKGTE